MKVKIGKRIESIRKEMQMTKEDFAKLIGMSGQYLGTIEHGKNCISIEKLITLSKITGKSTDYILLGKETPLSDEYRKALSELSPTQIKYTNEILHNLVLLLKSAPDLSNFK